MIRQKDLQVKNLGPCHIESTLMLSIRRGDRISSFVRKGKRVLFDVHWDEDTQAQYSKGAPLVMELAGPRKMLFFNPKETNAAIVTCGGLCPGINNVIRSLVMTMHHRYGVRNIYGVQYGYQGFIPEYNLPLIELTHERVANIHQFGGTILGSSRGKQDVSRIVDCLEKNDINMLFTIGGDGTLAGALAIQKEIEKRGLKIAVAGIPKTIDNDINHIEKTFGFETSFTIASPIIRDAHNEAIGAYNGVAIVKLMGRDSGFIAANAALSMPEVNIVLVPEVKFDLEGPKGLFALVRERLERRKHCLIVVAEGAGQYFFENMESEIDPSGNKRHHDIGLFLKEQISGHFKKAGWDITVKYIDPSYIIRAAPATPSDSIFCNKLAINAVHGAMAGKTSFVVGRRNNKFVYLPIELVISKRKKIDIAGDLWLNVLETTGQPLVMTNEKREAE